MSATTKFRSIVGTLFDNSNSIISTSSSEIRDYLNSFPEPNDDIERAFFQYKATMYQFEKRGPAKFILNLAGALAYYPYVVFLLLAGKCLKREKKRNVFFTDRISKDTIPSSVLNRYPDLVELKMAEKMSLSKEDVNYIKTIKEKYRFHFYFNLKILLKIAMISDAIRRYSPDAIITYSEASFSTSIATNYCEKNAIKLIGIMHGERLYSFKLAFFRCSEYYAWDKDYVNVLLSLRCEKNQFRVEVPIAVALPDYKGNTNAKYDYTFYLQDETDETLNRLHNVLIFMKKNNFNVCIRPHPDFVDLVRTKFSNDFEYENPRKVSLVTSFENTHCVIAKFSTVLFQAWYVGLPIVIDDYTSAGLYEMLQSKGYVVLKKTHKRLTSLIREWEIENESSHYN